MIPWTVAYEVPPSMGFSRQEYWSGLPFPSLGDLPDPWIEPGSPALYADALLSELPGKLILCIREIFKNIDPLIKEFKRFLIRFMGSDLGNFKDTIIKIYPRTDLVVHISNWQSFYSLVTHFFCGGPVCHIYSS